ncbi:MAG: acetylhydrolase [Burkholderiales bacterium]|nr:MAG: acetylhydrolase [Burkholderiales bacterium]
MRLPRRSFLLAASSAAALGAFLAVPGARSLRAQERAFDAIDLDWVDAGRDRPVPVRLYLPHAATPDRPVPLAVFSHGIGGSRRGYSYLGSHWASEGVASLHLQHVGSDRSLWGAGSPFALIGRLQDAAQDAEAIARVHDLRFALDRLLADALGDRIDAQRIVAAGHSYGANTTLLAAGARVERAGREIDLLEPRLRAAIVISAPPFYGEPSPRRILEPIRIPSLHVTATEDIIRIPGYYSGAEDRVAVFDAIGHPRKTLAVFSGGSHSMFTDRAGSGGAALNAQVKTATRELTGAFLRSVFDGDDSGLRDWPQRHAAILARFVAPA